VNGSILRIFWGFGDMIGGFPGCDYWKKSKPGGAPPSYKWVIIPLTMDISPINHSDIGLIGTNLANELGPHP